MSGLNDVYEKALQELSGLSIFLRLELLERSMIYLKDEFKSKSLIVNHSSGNKISRHRREMHNKENIYAFIKGINISQVSTKMTDFLCSMDLYELGIYSNINCTMWAIKHGICPEFAQKNRTKGSPRFFKKEDVLKWLHMIQSE